MHHIGIWNSGGWGIVVGCHLQCAKPGWPPRELRPQAAGAGDGETEPALARLDEPADYIAYAARHPGMGLPSAEDVDIGRNVVVTVAELACDPDPPYLRLEGITLVGGFAENDEAYVCEAETEYHAAFRVSRSMLPND